MNLDQWDPLELPVAAEVLYVPHFITVINTVHTVVMIVTINYASYVFSQGDRGETGPPGPAGFAGPPVSVIFDTQCY